MKIEKENLPIVSVIICVYNRRNYIERAISSLLNQSLKNYEAIVVDDGSTDCVEEILFKYLKEYKNFKYFRHSNRNLPLSKNVGISISQGKYITFLDSDDEYEKEHLEKMVKFMEEHLDFDFIHSSPKIIGGENDLWLVDARDESKLININNCVVGPTFFGKKDVFLKLKGFNDLSYAEDFEFFNRLINSGLFKTGKLQERTYVYYRSIEDSITNLAKKMQLRETNSWVKSLNCIQSSKQLQ